MKAAHVLPGFVLLASLSTVGIADQTGARRPPKRIKYVEPVYPAECPRLEKAAIAAARKWRYEQIRLNNQAVAYKLSMVSVPFRLPPSSKPRERSSDACVWKEPPKPLT